MFNVNPANLHKHWTLTFFKKNVKNEKKWIRVIAGKF